VLCHASFLHPYLLKGVLKSHTGSLPRSSCTHPVFFSCSLSILGTSKMAKYWLWHGSLLAPHSSSFNTCAFWTGRGEDTAVKFLKSWLPRIRGVIIWCVNGSGWVPGHDVNTKTSQITMGQLRAALPGTRHPYMTLIWLRNVPNSPPVHICASDGICP
jgi:hypothetical protein